jgi:signal transduction histidine kinase
MKTQFLGTTAHELRTPMTPVLLQLDLLQREKLGALTDRQRRSVELLGRNLQRLNVLVEDVLDIARVQSGKLRLAPQGVDLGLLAAEAAESFHSSAEAAGIVLEVQASQALPVRADPRRLTQVLFNLLGNAMKFTPRGGRIVVEARREDGTCAVSVADTGAGLRAEDLPKLFQPFSQVSDPAARAHAGAGLGLFICRAIVEAHGGTIVAESRGPGLGACFTFRLPLAAPTPAAAPDGGLSLPSAAGTPPARA